MIKGRSQERPGTAEGRRTFCPRAVALSALALSSLLLASSLSNPTARADPIETDHFPNSLATLEIEIETEIVQMTLTGPTTVEVDLGSLADTDHDGREQVDTEIVSMQLTGFGALGPATLRLRDPADHPFQRTVGEIEETANNTPGVLDIPPFTATGTADSFFDVFFEVEVAGMVLHNDTPKHMEETITHKPPVAGETYESPEWIPLFDELENPTGVEVGPAFHTPSPAVGGIAQLPDVASGSGSSTGTYAALAGGLAALVVILSAGAWYARRRWSR